MAQRTTHGDVLDGARVMAPVIAGLVPAGIAVGAAWSTADLPVGPGIAAAATVYGASAQLVLVETSARSAGLAVVALAIAITSLRLALVGLGLGRHLADGRAAQRWTAALLLVEPAYLVADRRFTEPTASATAMARAARRRFFFGAAGSLWLAWQVAHTIGLLAGAAALPGLALDRALPLCLLGLLAPRVRDRASVLAASAATVVALAARGAPLGSGLLVAVVVGVAVAQWRPLDNRSSAGR